MGGRAATAVVQQAIPPFRGDRTAPPGRWARGEDERRPKLSNTSGLWLFHRDKEEVCERKSSVEASVDSG